MRKYALTFLAMILISLPVACLQFPLNAQQTSNAVAKSTSQVENSPRDGTSLKVFSLRHSDAAELVQTITPLFNMDSATRVVTVFDKRTNTIIARGPKSELEVLELVLERLDQPTTAQDTNAARRLVGTWKLEKATTPGTPSGIGSRLKMFTGTHWFIIQPDPTTGLIVFQHGGRYEYDGETLTTTTDFAGDSTQDRIGYKGKFKVKLNDDTMSQLDSENTFNETWKRVK